MLHNILLKANTFTEITKMGKHINIVLAAGEIIARIRYESGKVEETRLISGMAFETKEPFVSVAFSADDSQQTKVWLSNLPLTYSPSETRIVGSAALVSSELQMFYGEPKQVLPAENGRGKVTIYTPEQIYIGGTNLSLSNGIKIAADSTFEIATQGAIFGFTLDSQYQPYFISMPNEATLIDYGVAPSGYATLFSSAVGRDSDGEQNYIFGRTQYGAFIFFDSEVQTTGNVSDITTGASVGTRALALNNHLYGLTQISSNLHLCDIDMATRDVTQTQLKTGIANSSITFAYDGENIFYSGNTNGEYGTVGNMQASTMPSGLTAITEAFFMPDGALVIVDSASKTAVSNDKGATFTDFVDMPFTLYDTKNVYLDSVTGALYASSGTTLHKSVDNGQTWNVVYLASSNIKEVYARENGLYLACFYSLDYTTDEGQTWVSKSWDNVGGTSVAADCRSVIVDSQGTIFCFDYSKFHRLQGEAVAVGGLKVAVMAEVN